MSNTQTVKGAFQPLNRRLYEFESKDYLRDYYEIVDVDPEVIIKLLVRNVNLFEDSMVYLEAQKYENRILKILENLKPREKEVKLNIQNEPVGIKSISKDKKAELMLNWKHELHSYLNCLRVIIENSDIGLKIGDTPKATKEPTVFNLPENFQAPDYTGKGFKPEFNTREVALFFHYMMALKYMPPYDDSNISILATPFFGVSSPNSRRELGKIHSIKTASLPLHTFKEKIESILAEISKDLEKLK